MLLSESIHSLAFLLGSQVRERYVEIPRPANSSGTRTTRSAQDDKAVGVFRR
jgi:hypothetical protein